MSTDVIPNSWTFLVPSLARPAGGTIAMNELALALAQRGHEVNVVHLPSAEATARSLHDLPWLRSDDQVNYLFARDLDPDAIPKADLVVFAPLLVATARSRPEHAGDALIELLRATDAPAGSPAGLPIVMLQGLGVFPPEVERLAIEFPGPKLCVGSWLSDEVVRQGVSCERAVHIPNGLDHTTFRVTQAITSRRAQVAMNFDPHPVKGGQEGLTALEQLHHETGASGAVFGTRRPATLPTGVDFTLGPTQPSIALGIYNQSAIFLQPSRREGFGMCAVESMACGCALVTTANGGATDYAEHEETAIVCGNEPHEMADSLRRLVDDEPLRVRLATNGAAFVERFRWELSAERLEALGLAYRRTPSEYGVHTRHHSQE